MKKGEKLEIPLQNSLNQSSGLLVTADSFLFKKVIEAMIKPFRKKKFDKVMAPEMKGMFYGPTIAYKLGLPFVFISKSGRVPKKVVVGKKYTDYSKKSKKIEIAKTTIQKGEKILLVDDIFETGESAKAALHLIKSLGGKIEGISIVYNKLDKKTENFFKKYNFHYLCKPK